MGNNVIAENLSLKKETSLILSIGFINIFIFI